MDITRIPTALSRRAFLRSSCGAGLALPWMESLDARTTSTRRPPPRVAFIYVPMGMVREEFFPGEQKKPEQHFQGAHPHISTRTLRPLDKMGANVTLITGLDRTWKNTADQHEQCGCCFLSSIAPSTSGGRMPQGRTLDHLIATRLGTGTPFRTLEFNANPHRDNRESIHFDTISWYGPEYPAIAMRDPQQIYRRLFTRTAAAPAQRITDLVLADAKSMARRLGRDDREKLGEYVESIRSIEVQMDRLGAMRAELEKMNLPEPPAAHLPRGEYLRLMGDFMVAALQSGLTHVATLMIAPERWETPYRFEEISDKPLGHHSLSHGGWSEELRKIDEFHVRQFAYLLEKMNSIREADGSTLLDNTLLTFGSGLGQGAAHTYDRLPILVAGSGGGRFKTGIHLKCPAGTPLANLWLTQSRAVGIDQESFADSTGILSGLIT
ncbi:MAG: DUF1552 domain-containing protein [Prosthecobacter sp.]